MAGPDKEIQAIEKHGKRPPETTPAGTELAEKELEGVVHLASANLDNIDDRSHDYKYDDVQRAMLKDFYEHMERMPESQKSGEVLRHTLDVMSAERQQIATHRHQERMKQSQQLHVIQVKQIEAEQVANKERRRHKIEIHKQRRTSIVQGFALIAGVGLLVWGTPISIVLGLTLTGAVMSRYAKDKFMETWPRS